MAPSRWAEVYVRWGTSEGFIGKRKPRNGCGAKEDRNSGEGWCDREEDRGGGLKGVARRDVPAGARSRVQGDGHILGLSCGRAHPPDGTSCGRPGARLCEKARAEAP